MRNFFIIIFILNVSLLSAQNIQRSLIANSSIQKKSNINNETAFSKSKTLVFPVDTFTLIYSMVPQVDTVQMYQSISYLEGLGDRNCLGSNITTAQNWISNKFQTMGFTPTLQPVEVWGSSAGANVIAMQTGTVSPNEYVVVGGHYDSYSFSGAAPGADDDASGTAGVIEIARILKNYNFERTIIYCAFTGEEYGLYGSDTCVALFDNAGMNILGYFNLDMIGYSDPDSVMHTDIICPTSAMPLSDFFIAVKNIFVPSLPAHNASLSGGDSDHTSFNNHGYMGIFPFENVNAYSPEIHYPTDLIGASVNNFRFAKFMTQSNLAALATLARPVGLVGVVDQNMPCLQIFPNPASEEINILSPINESVKLSVFNAMGENVFSCEFQGKYLLSLQHFPKGIYFITCQGKGFSATSKFVRQ